LRFFGGSDGIDDQQAGPAAVSWVIGVKSSTTLYGQLGIQRRVDRVLMVEERPRRVAVGRRIGRDLPPRSTPEALARLSTMICCFSVSVIFCCEQPRQKIGGAAGRGGGP